MRTALGLRNIAPSEIITDPSLIEDLISWSDKRQNATSEMDRDQLFDHDIKGLQLCSRLYTHRMHKRNSSSVVVYHCESLAVSANHKAFLYGWILTNQL